MIVAAMAVIVIVSLVAPAVATLVAVTGCDGEAVKCAQLPDPAHHLGANSCATYLSFNTRDSLQFCILRNPSRQRGSGSSLAGAAGTALSLLPGIGHKRRS